MISIIDYGLGNITAFINVFERLGVTSKAVSSVNQLAHASSIILPGVGAFDHAMTALNKSGMRECLDDLVLNRQVPVIGICVGMQMMAKSSEEGSLPGLGWLDATVRKFSFNQKDYGLTPLPHMGWNDIHPVVEHSLFSGLDSKRRFYFLHSYYFECVNQKEILATASYGHEYACLVNKENIYGIQCHPEKSHHNGVQLLKNFTKIRSC